MTRLLYYDDAYTTSFTAQVIERFTFEDCPAIVLDRTYFYPTGGGQPSDRGVIAGVQVVDVVACGENEAIIHCLSAPIDEDWVSCQIDWERRFDHMQQHTGQHILSQAFLRVTRAETIGFHLGDTDVTIDLNATNLPPTALEHVEDLANQIVYEDRVVTTRFLAPGELTQDMLRGVIEGTPPDNVRVVEIQDFDSVPCGGTHVARTGEIGTIKILRPDKRGQNVRIMFRCGWRALRDYQRKNAIVNQLAAEFTVGAWELDQAIARLREENKALRSEIRAAQAQLIEYAATTLLQKAPVRDGVRVVKAVFANRDVKELRALAARLNTEPDTVVLLGVAGDKAQLILARSQDVSLDMVTVLKQALEILGTQQGGGRPDYAQGGGVPADTSLVKSALDQAEDTVFSLLG